MIEKNVEKKKTDYRKCPYCFVRECSWESYDEKPCLCCIAGKIENHLYQIRLSLPKKEKK